MAKRSGVTITKDISGQILSQTRDLIKKRVLIGITAETAGREPLPGEPESKINNAEIGYLMETGSPANNLPARPFLVPGVMNARDAIAKEMKKGAIAALKGGANAADIGLNAAGLAGVNGAQAKITEGPFVPLSPKTVANRARQRQSASRRKGEIKYLEMVASGMSPGDAEAAAGIRPLENTGQLRRAITYVVRMKGDN